jgi:acetylornithine deacetylase
MKASAAAQLAVTKALLDAGIELAGDLILTFVADEEYASIGTEHIAQNYTTDGAIVTEPTELQVCTTHRGFVWYEIVTTGLAAHGSRYMEGIDANSHMGRVLVELEKLGQALRHRPEHPLVGHPSLHAAQIQGGNGISTYAEHCSLKVERRLNPGETEASATAEIQAILDQLSAADPQFKATVKPFFTRLPFATADDSPLVQVSDAAIAARLGAPRPHLGMLGWTDAAILADAGIEAILLGPSGDGAHAAEEWVDIASTVDLCHILVDIVLNYCGAA